MSLHRRNPKRDGNERIIIDALEAQGFCVMPISGTGIPDLVVTIRTHGRQGPMWIVEIKQPKGTYTAAQNLWRSKWSGPRVVTLRSVEDARRFALLAYENGDNREA